MCVYPFITPVSCFVYFGCAGSVRISLAGRVIDFFVWDSAVWSARAGTIYLSASLEWMAGLYRFFSLALLWRVRYG